MPEPVLHPVSTETVLSGAIMIEDAIRLNASMMAGMVAIGSTFEAVTV